MPREVHLNPNEVHIWHVSLDELKHGPAEHTLSETELAIANRFRSETDRARYLAAHLALRLILARYVRAEPKSIRFTTLPRGKPIIHGVTNEPRLEFNMSHSRGIAIYAMSLNRRVGVDVEAIVQDIYIDGLMAQVCSGPERAALQVLNPVARRTAFFRLWTRKEAYVKAIGQGLFLPLDSFSVFDRCPTALVAPRASGAPDDVSYWSVSDLQIDPGFAAAVAIEGKVDHVAQAKWLDGQERPAIGTT